MFISDFPQFRNIAIVIVAPRAVRPNTWFQRAQPQVNPTVRTQPVTGKTKARRGAGQSWGASCDLLEHPFTDYCTHVAVCVAICHELQPFALAFREAHPKHE